jgi:thioredoxin-related protein
MPSPNKRDNLLKYISIFLLITCLSSTPLCLADTAKLPPLDDLQQLSRLATQSQLPVLLLVSQYHCSYCDRMKEEILQPMQLDPAYRQRVLIRELSIDPGETLTTLRGLREATSEFISQYEVSVTPTLLFLDAAGREAAERIVGINTVDFLLLYIDDAIEQATTRMRATKD